MEEKQSGFDENLAVGSSDNPETAASFPVDITREEFIRFNLIVSKSTGLMRFRNGQMILFGILGVLSLLSVLSDAVTYQRADGIMIFLVFFIAVMEGILLFGMSSYIKRTSGRAYDQTILTGNSYYGRVSVYPDRVEKQNANLKTTIPFQPQTMYIETRQMMILLFPNTPAIVLTATCLTKENADAVRKAVMTGLPATRQKLVDRMVPLAKTPIAPPSSEKGREPEAEQMHVDVTYTQDEFIKLATDTAEMGFMKALPLYSGLSTMTGLLFGLLYNFGVGIFVFILTVGGIFAVNILGVRAKANRSYQQMTESGTRIGISFTVKGITVRSPTTRESIGMIWESITRAVERREYIEFYTRTAFLRIPKHCIENIGLLKEIVDSHIHTASVNK